MAAMVERAEVAVPGPVAAMLTRLRAALWLACQVVLVATAEVRAGPALATAADVATQSTVAVFPIEIADTSGEPANPQWPQRIRTVTAELALQLAASGKYRPVDLGAASDRIAAVEPIHRCDGCWRGLAREVGADAAAITVVHKISTLVSSMHVWLVDVTTQKLIRQGAVSLRGDTEEAWRRALGFLLRRGILSDRGGHPMLSSPFPGG